MAHGVQEPQRPIEAIVAVTSGTGFFPTSTTAPRGRRIASTALRLFLFSYCQSKPVTVTEIDK